MYQKKYTVDQINQFKQRRAAKDKLIRTNKYDEWFDTRWIGYPGENTFDALLNDWYGFVDGIEYIHHETDTGYDYKDFTIAHEKCNLEIDVKTVGLSRDPLPLDKTHCVPVKQYQKITGHYRETGSINTLVFCSYNKVTNTCFAVGYLTVPEFIKRSEYKEKGEFMGMLKLSTAAHFIRADQLHPFVNKRGVF